MPESNIFHGRHGERTDITRLAGQVFGEDRVALVRHGRRALLPLAEELLDLQHLGPLQMADLNGNPFHGRSDNREDAEIFGVAVTRDHLS